MLTIQLIENGRESLFSAKNDSDVIGSLGFYVSGPGKIVVHSIVTPAGLASGQVAGQLLNELHRYAYYEGYRIRFQCPKAKAVNDRQIEQELLRLDLATAVAA